MKMNKWLLEMHEMEEKHSAALGRNTERVSTNEITGGNMKNESNGLTKKELELAARFLEYFSEELGGNCCNDWNFPKDWTEEEKAKFVKDFHEFNGDPEEFDPKHLHLHDYCAVALLSSKLKEHAKSLPQEAPQAHQEANRPRSIDELWVPSNVPLPIKGNKEYEKVEAAIKKDWEGVAEFEKRAPTSTFDISRMHYSPIPVPKELIPQEQQSLNIVTIGSLGGYIVYVGLTREEAIERWKNEHPNESLENNTNYVEEFKVKDSFGASEVYPHDPKDKTP